jgi:hypothetical protein
MAAEGGPAAVLLKDVSRVAVADWSANGKSIFFLDSRATGRDEIWKADSESGSGGRQLTRNGAGPLRASPDGKFIYYAKGTPAQPELWRVAVSGEDEIRVLERISTDGNFEPAQGGVYFSLPPDETGNAKLVFLNAHTLSTRNIAGFRGYPMWGITLSPNGRNILHAELLHGESDLMLVERFR